MPDSEAILTIRPSPAARMAVNAARPHRNEPVRLTPIVSSQMSNVVSPKGADDSTPAAQTRAASGPTCPAAANSRSTSPGLLTSAGDAVGPAPAFRLGAPDPVNRPRSHAPASRGTPRPA